MTRTSDIELFLGSNDEITVSKCYVYSVYAKIRDNDVGRHSVGRIESLDHEQHLKDGSDFSWCVDPACGRVDKGRYKTATAAIQKLIAIHKEHFDL